MPFRSFEIRDESDMASIQSCTIGRHRIHGASLLIDPGHWACIGASAVNHGMEVSSCAESVIISVFPLPWSAWV